MTTMPVAPTATSSSARPRVAGAILSRFGFTPGGTVSGVAAGGRFLDVPSGPLLETFDPTTGTVLARIQTAAAESYQAASDAARAAFLRWRSVPAPVRGETVRLLGLAFRERKEDLARLISLENGKILSEARGEVQEVIDMCDFAVGQSRMLYGKQMPSERREHRLFEQWHPLGVVGIISAFNFPVAVPGWGWALALVCGDAVLWKPSSLTPLISIACQQLFHTVTNGTDAEGVFNLVIGSGSTVGERLLADPTVPLVQATGSSALGERVSAATGRRGARAILELGGNNALVVLDDADQEMALRSVLFGAVGTAGQRCTSTRRLILQRGIAEGFVERLARAYGSVAMGDPLDDGRTLMGPLISADAVRDFEAGVAEIVRQGGEIIHGGSVLHTHGASRRQPGGGVDDEGAGGRVADAATLLPGPGGYFVQPTLVRSRLDMPIVQEEIFAPILHVLVVDSLEEAIEANNAVPQGLSSCLFTTSLRSAEVWLSAVGSDCGLSNVNVGTSGAEIGGAFGGEKLTGGGRQAGSDAWKAYMRRQTSALNYGTGLVLAQGVQFDTDPASRSAIG